MKSLVVTGGIATGKSTAVSKLLNMAEGKVLHFDCDKAAHELLTTEEISRNVSSRFGVDILGPEGLVDRSALREVVFADVEKRKSLERLLHPEILQRAIAAQHAAASSESGEPELFLIEIPLFYEVDFPVSHDGVVVIATTEQTQSKRLREDRGLSDEIISDIFKSQLPIDRKVDMADYVIWNNGPPDEIDAQLQLLLDSFDGNNF